MDINELYNGLARLKKKGEVLDAYGGSPDIYEPDANILMEFYEYIVEHYEDELPVWAETFIQIFSWQYQTFHEGSITYYENFYGHTDYQKIIKVAEYLQQNGYNGIVKPYVSPAFDCSNCDYPDNMKHFLAETEKWMYENEETVWYFYVDILEKNKIALLS